MPQPSRRWEDSARRGLRIGTLLCTLTVCWAAAAMAETGAPVRLTTQFAALPELSGSSWTRVGDAPALVLSGARLLLNDNSGLARVAYQTWLGEIEAADRVTVRAEVQVLSNLDGDGALVEISRPGLEVILRLRPLRVDLVERASARETRWLGSAAVDLSSPHEILLTKNASDGVEGEWVSVEIDGQEVIRALPRGGANLSVGRVLIGSLSYPGYGASIWSWIDLSRERVQPDTRVRTESTSVGQLKSRWSGF